MPVKKRIVHEYLILAQSRALIPTHAADAGSSCSRHIVMTADDKQNDSAFHAYEYVPHRFPLVETG